MAEKSRSELEQASRENITFMLDAIKKKLKVVNVAAIRSEGFDTEQYEDLLDLYDYVQKKDHFTTSELDSILSELGQLRK